MSDQTLTDQQLHSAYSRQRDARTAGRELVEALGDVDAAAVAFFASPALDGRGIGQTLGARFPGAAVIGCSTAGQFTENDTAAEGVSAVAIPTTVARRCAAALAELDGDIDAGVHAAVGRIEEQLGMSLRDADPGRYVGLLLVDGVHGSEERVNDVLGNVAPLLSFVGGSAGDDMAFEQTRVYCGATASTHGAALLVLETAVPFTVVKTCSFEPTGRTFTITEADVAARVVWQLDGRPAAEVYAEAVGRSIDTLDSSVFMSHPVGLMIDGKPWIRSPQRVVDGRGVKFFCQILPGMDVELMRSTDLIGDTRAALRSATAALDGRISGAVMFNCILRRLEIDANGWGQPFIDAISTVPTAGFHTYGESWLGHMNQTLTAILFGR